MATAHTQHVIWAACHHKRGKDMIECDRFRDPTLSIRTQTM